MVRYMTRFLAELLGSESGIRTNSIDYLTYMTSRRMLARHTSLLT